MESVFDLHDYFSEEVNEISHQMVSNMDTLRHRPPHRHSPPACTLTNVMQRVSEASLEETPRDAACQAGLEDAFPDSEQARIDSMLHHILSLHCRVLVEAQLNEAAKSSLHCCIKEASPCDMQSKRYDAGNTSNHKDFHSKFNDHVHDVEALKCHTMKNTELSKTDLEGCDVQNAADIQLVCSDAITMSHMYNLNAIAGNYKNHNESQMSKDDLKMVDKHIQNRESQSMTEISVEYGQHKGTQTMAKDCTRSVDTKQAARLLKACERCHSTMIQELRDIVTVMQKSMLQSSSETCIFLESPIDKESVSWWRKLLCRGSKQN